jgi:hypothetical protein
MASVGVPLCAVLGNNGMSHKVGPVDVENGQDGQVELEEDVELL